MTTPGTKHGPRAVRGWVPGGLPLALGREGVASVVRRRVQDGCRIAEAGGDRVTSHKTLLRGGVYLEYYLFYPA